MKIRIKGNTIRLRLSQLETQQLDNDGIVKESTTFGVQPDAHFFYALRLDETAKTITAVFLNNEIRVALPYPLGSNWIHTDLVGVSAEMPIGDGRFLSILIEKDFKCLTDREGEDETNNFPNPNEVC